MFMGQSTIAYVKEVGEKRYYGWLQRTMCVI